MRQNTGCQLWYNENLTVMRLWRVRPKGSLKVGGLKVGGSGGRKCRTNYLLRSLCLGAMPMLNSAPMWVYLLSLLWEFDTQQYHNLTF